MTAERQTIFRMIVKVLERKRAGKGDQGFADYYMLAAADQIVVFVADAEEILPFISQVAVFEKRKVMIEKA